MVWINLIFDNFLFENFNDILWFNNIGNPNEPISILSTRL